MCAYIYTYIYIYIYIDKRLFDSERAAERVPKNTSALERWVGH